MCIKIYPDALALTLTDFDGECCIFCGINTFYWNEQTNRPICRDCAAKYDENDILKAPFNY